MIFKPTLISAIILAAALVSLFTAYISWQRRKTEGGEYFAWAMLALTFWILASTLDYAAVSLPLKIFFAKLEYIGYHSALALMAMYSVWYAGHEDWLKRLGVRIFFVFIPASNILMAWTNELHGWLWTGFTSDPTGNNAVNFVHGPGFLWTTLSGYLWVIIIAVNLVQVMWIGTDLARKQARLLLLALLIPVSANLLYLFDAFNLPGMDWDAITFSITGIVFLIALYGTNVLELIPIARNVLIERLPDGVLVLDSWGRLADFNPAMASIFGIDQADLWKPVQRVFASWPEIVGVLAQPEERSVEIVTGLESKAFDLLQTSLKDQAGNVYGQLVTLRNISERKRMESILRFSEEKFYKAFHSSPDAILITRLDNGQIVDVNDGFCRLFGYSRKDALAASTLDLDLWANLDDRKALVDDLAESGSVQDREYQFRTKSDILIDATYLGEIILLDGEKHAVSSIHDLTQRKQSERELLAAQEQELARAEERQRMARDLHDSVSQSIHSLVLFAETLDAVIQKGNFDRARKLTNQVTESSRQAHKETRLLLYELQTLGPKRTIDLVPALEERLEKVERHTGLRAELV